MFSLILRQHLMPYETSHFTGFDKVAPFLGTRDLFPTDVSLKSTGMLQG